MHAQAYCGRHGDIKPRSDGGHGGHTALEPSSVGHPDRALRSAVPRRARRFDGRRRPARHPDRPRAVHVLAAVGRQRLRARLRRPPAALPPRRPPAPAGLSLLAAAFREGPMRNRAISIYSAFGASGFSLGLVLSGLLTEVSWRLTLLVPAPVALLTLIAAIRFVPRGEQVTRSGRKFDIPGAITVTGAMLLLVYTVVAAQQAGWGSARTIGSFAAVVVALAGFVVIERRSADPLVPLGIFPSGALTRANIGAMTLFGSYVSFQFLVTQYLQSLAGWSALSTALAFLPAGVMVAILSTRMGSIIGRYGPAP